MRKNLLSLLLFLLCFMFCGFYTCTRSTRTDTPPQVEDIAKDSPTPEMKKVEEQDLIKSNAKKILGKMNLTEKIYQVLILPIEGKNDISVRAERFEYPPGGVILFRFNFDKDPTVAYKFIKTYKQKFKNKIPPSNNKTFIQPFFATDNEGGDVFRTRGLTSTLPYPSKFTKQFSLTEAEELFLFNAEQMNALGLSMNLAPICEYGSPQSSFLGSRIFDANPKTVSTYASSFVIAHKKGDIICVVKHFPGCGNLDTHKNVSKIYGTYNDFLTLCESFRVPLKHAQAVMLSHAIATALDDLPFCLSEKCIHFLKNEFQYEGLIMTDDITMKALHPYAKNNIDLVYKLILAGCDLILSSASDYNNLINGLVKKAEADTNFVKRLDEAVEKILIAKIKNHLIGEEEYSSFDSAKFYSAKSESEKILNKSFK